MSWLNDPVVIMFVQLGGVPSTYKYGLIARLLRQTKVKQLVLSHLTID